MDGLYFDTSIWLDFYEKRGDNGEEAFKLIMKVLNNDFKVYYSDLHIRELRNLGFTFREISSILGIAKPKNIRHLHIFREQLDEARVLSNQRAVPRKDALHAILARDNDLTLISRDNHFNKLKDISEAKLPEDFT